MLGLGRKIGMRAIEFSLEDKAAVQMFGLALAKRNAFPRVAIVFRHDGARDRVDKTVIRRGRLRRFLSRNRPSFPHLSGDRSDCGKRNRGERKATWNDA